MGLKHWGKLLLIGIFLGAFFPREAVAESPPTYLQLSRTVKAALYSRDNEIHYEVSASIEGAAHGIVPCKSCESFPGQYSNTIKNAFDYMQKWINARFNR